MDRDEFIQITSTIRSLEKNFLNSSDFDKLIKSKDLNEALTILRGTIYQEKLLKLDRPENYEIVLENEKFDYYNKIYSMCPSKEVIDFTLLGYKFHNLKVFLKELIFKKNLSDLYFKSKEFNPENIKKLFESKSSYLEPDYITFLKETYIKYIETKNPQIIDINLDNNYLQKLKLMANDMNVSLFKEYAEDLIDFTNIKTMIRCKFQNKDVSFLKNVLVDEGNIDKNELINLYKSKIEGSNKIFKKLRIYELLRKGIDSYNSKNTFTEFEKIEDNYILSLAKKTKFMSYGPEVVFGNLIGKEMENKNLSIILSSKLNNWDISFINERFRDLYV